MEILEKIQLTTDLQQVITTDQAWHYGIIPKHCNGSLYEFYIDEKNFNKEISKELEMLFGKRVELSPVNSETINLTLGSHYRKGQRRNSPSAASHTKFSDDFLDKIICEAHEIGCSDIHGEAYENNCRIRMRLDGKLIERYILDHRDYPALINKIKIKSNLDIAEKRLPQDGRICYSNGRDKFDIRVSILPSLFGEKAVLRLLSRETTNIDIENLGFDPAQLMHFKEAVRKPHGIVLISGPTGSGKTTTLYATLKILNNVNTNILTIEDPVEYTLEGINQVQLKESIGLTFASALRTFLRQDPDIIMLGEIRDGETAEMAIRAALTGHLVLSTIHTNSAWGTINRLIDMGIPPFLLAGTINLTAAQRLVRVLCPICREKHDFVEGLYPASFSPPRRVLHHYTPKGCSECFYTGYRGRKALYEVIPVDNDLSMLIRGGGGDPSGIISDLNISTLADAAFGLFERGETSIDEVYSILMNQ